MTLDIFDQNKSEDGILATPESGQLVEARRRQWIVVEVDACIGPRETTQPQHHITLASIDEDSLGEQIEVIWEIEPGAHIIEHAGLPKLTGRDDPAHLEAFLDAVRWGAATNADRGFLQAPFRSGISIEDFQLDPLVRAIGMARANLLIADDVGLGKTIEAGLVIQELLLRHRARTVFIVCPASLQEKWRLEMLEKFGLDFKIVNSDYVRQLRRDRGIHANPWTSFPRLIASVDWIKAGEPLRLLKDVLPVGSVYPRKFDLLVIDEAHNIAPSGSANYTLESQRTRLVRTIAPHFQHKLFLTATPHNGYTQSFTSLLELLDDQRFSRNILPSERQLSQVMVRRLKTDLVDADGNPLYPKRVLKPLAIPYSEPEREIHAMLRQYCESRKHTCRETGGMAAHFVNKLLQKRLFSSPAAFAATLEKHRQNLATPDQSNQKTAFSERILKRMIEQSEEDYADDAQVEDIQDEAVEEASRHLAPLTAEERKLLSMMSDWADNNRHKTDSKAKALIAWLEKNLRPNDDWNDARVILFTEYRTTLDWLKEILTAQGYGGDRLAIIHGGIDHADRETIKAAFQTHPSSSSVRILLATDAASEGIDLQNHCNSLIHIEIPYNPNVMEQRNGRIDRHGQKAKEVLIWHPVDGGDVVPEKGVGGHSEDIIRALVKLESMRADMGSVNPVIAPQMAELIEGARKELNTKEAELRAAKAKRFIRAERNLTDRIAKLHDRLLETRKDFHLTPERICQAVHVGLALADKPPLKSATLNGAPDGTVFILPEMGGSWGKCLEGLRHPHTQVTRPITFDHDVAKGRDDVVLVHMNHRLVQMCLRLMRAEVWAGVDVKKLHRVAIRVVPDALLDGPAVAINSRLVITGGNHHRLHEELTASGGYLSESGFARETGVTKVTEWFAQSRPVDINDSLFQQLVDRFETAQSSIDRAVTARSTDRLRNLSTTLETRKKQEQNTIETVLTDLEKSIQTALAESAEPEQLVLFQEDQRFSNEEKAQFRRDIEAIKIRLAKIPQERDREIKDIERRYDGYVPRTFPVAVIFFLPERLANRSAL
ncbi:DISARM system SNF2-like helicase DrmD [Hyphococcus lacteus]|uniref:DISARM system SNF2-like helicase DrmD n=1 Tax=Hyphococcus lacteus TaxID=3143536 RepID=A0ABV3Z757_9PROT